MVHLEVLFEEESAIHSQLVICVAAHLHDQAQHETVFVDGTLSALLNQRGKQAVAELALLESGLAIRELVDCFQGYELNVREINLADDVVEDLDPAVLEGLVVVAVVGHDVDA